MSQMRARALCMYITNTTPNPSPKNLTSTHPPLSHFQSKAMELIFWNTKFLNRFLLCLGTWGEWTCVGNNPKLGWTFFGPKAWFLMIFSKKGFHDHVWWLIFLSFQLCFGQFISTDSYGCFFIYSNFFGARKHSNLVQFYKNL